MMVKNTRPLLWVSSVFILLKTTKACTTHRTDWYN